MPDVKLSSVAGAAAQFFDNNGNPLAGGKIYTYNAGTTTPRATYTSSTGVTPNSNPIILDSTGRTPNEIWMEDQINYKFELKTSGDVLIGTYDNLPPINDSSYIAGIYANLANTSDPTKGDALIGFRQSNLSGNLTGSVGRTVHTKFQEYISVLDFGADPTGILDSGNAFRNAIQNALPGQTVTIPQGNYTVSGGILIPQGVNVQGQGSGYDVASGVIIKTTSGTIFTTSVFNGDSQMSKLSGVTLVKAGSASYGVFVRASDFIIENVNIAPFTGFTGFTEAGIGMDTGKSFDSSGLYLKNVKIDSCTRGVRLVRANNTKIDSCHIVSCGTLIDATTCSSLSISHGRLFLLGTGAGAETNTSKVLNLTTVKGLEVNNNQVKVASGTSSAIGQRFISCSTVTGGTIESNYIETSVNNSNSYSLINLGSASKGLSIQHNSCTGMGASSYLVEGSSLPSNIVGNNLLPDTSTALEFNNSFTPVLPVGLTATTIYGRYTRGPGFITLAVKFTVNTNVGGATNLSISGLPLLLAENMSNAEFSGPVLMSEVGNQSTAQSVAYINDSNRDTIYFKYRNTGANSINLYTLASLTGNSVISFQITYPVRLL